MQAVLFDFDGVIIDSEWPIYQSWLRVYQAEGHDLTVPDYAQCIGSDFETWSPEKLLEEKTGKTFDWDVINAKRQVEIETELEDVEPLEGIIPLLEWLQSKNIATAVVSSSTHRWVDMWLEKLNLLPYFQDVVCRGDAPKIKPAPDLYLEGAKRLSIDPAKCVVIEDSFNGVKSAKAANCLAYAVPSRLTECLSFDIADKVFASLPEMATELKTVFEK